MATGFVITVQLRGTLALTLIDCVSLRLECATKNLQACVFHHFESVKRRILFHKRTRPFQRSIISHFVANGRSGGTNAFDERIECRYLLVVGFKLFGDPFAEKRIEQMCNMHETLDEATVDITKTEGGTNFGLRY